VPYDSFKGPLSRRPGANMADRDPWQSLTRYSIVALIVIIIAWIIYAVAGGLSTPGPGPDRDTVAAPLVKP